MQAVAFQKSRVSLKGGLGFMRNRFRYMGFLDSNGYLNSDPGELVMNEGMVFNGHILDSFFKQGSLILPDGFKVEGTWHKNRLVQGTIKFPDLCDIESLTINEKENIFVCHIRSGKAFPIKDDTTLAFMDSIHNIKVTFSLTNKNLSVRVRVIPIQKSGPFSNFETQYELRPSLRFTKARHSPALTFSFDAYANFKTSYTIEQREEDKAKRKSIKLSRCVVYPSGQLFFGESQFPVERHEPNLMSGVLIDLDEYLLDKQGTRSFPHYDAFIFSNGMHPEKAEGEVSKAQIEFRLVGNIIENLCVQKSVFTSLKKRTIKQLSRSFEWSSYNKSYWEKVLEQKEAFHYKTGLSRPTQVTHREKALEPFDWTKVKPPYFGAIL
jgi:hypothetical protein